MSFFLKKSKWLSNKNGGTFQFSLKIKKKKKNYWKIEEEDQVL